MRKGEDWQPYSWYCANCGTMITGFRDKDGKIRVECKHCRVVMVRVEKGRRHNTIEVYAPKQARNEI